MSIAESARENRQSALFSTRRGRQIQNEELLLRPCYAKDLAIRSRSRTQHRALACRTDVAIPRRRSRNLWRNRRSRRFRFLSARNSLSFDSALQGKERVGIGPPSLVFSSMRGKFIQDHRMRILWVYSWSPMDSPGQGSERLNTQLLVDSIPGLIHAVRPSGYLDYFSKPYLEYLGVILDKLTCWNWMAFVHPEDVEGIVRAVKSDKCGLDCGLRILEQHLVTCWE